MVTINLNPNRLVHNASFYVVSHPCVHPGETPTTPKVTLLSTGLHSHGECWEVFIGDGDYWGLLVVLRCAGSVGADKTVEIPVSEEEADKWMSTDVG